jgi:hypothetical protein
MSVLRFLLASAVLLMVPLAVQAQEQIEFNLPSENIGCIYTPKDGVAHYQPVDGGPELLCDRVQPQYVRIILGPKGKAVLYKEVGDASCCAVRTILDYGETWKAGPFICKSSTKGLACQRGKNGFVMSRSRLKVY